MVTTRSPKGKQPSKLVGEEGVPVTAASPITRMGPINEVQTSSASRGRPSTPSRIAAKYSTRLSNKRQLLDNEEEEEPPLGNTNLRIFPPPTHPTMDEQEALLCLAMLDEELRQYLSTLKRNTDLDESENSNDVADEGEDAGTSEEHMKWCHNNVRQDLIKYKSSIRAIQGDRIEIFAQSTFKNETTVFDNLLKAVAIRLQQQRQQPASSPRRRTKHRTWSDIKEILLQYAIRQAGRDSSRFPSHQYKYNNFSILASYGPVDQQAPHIDLLSPNVQFALIITDLVSPTHTYHVPAAIETVEDLKYVWHKVPPSLLSAMADPETGIPDLIASYGNLLHPRVREEVIQLPTRADSPTRSSSSPPPLSPTSAAVTPPPSNGHKKRPRTALLLQRGTVTTLPGSVIHAAPQADSYRAILFFSGHPKKTAKAKKNAIQRQPTDRTNVTIETTAGTLAASESTAIPNSALEPAADVAGSDAAFKVPPTAGHVGPIPVPLLAPLPAPILPPTNDEPPVIPVVAEYDPDTQYFAPLLCAYFVSQRLWNRLAVSDRVYLLTKLANYMEVTMKISGVHHVHGHIDNDERQYTIVKEFIRNIEYGTYLSKYLSREKYIESYALLR
jgi:hypothetical protein